MSRRSTCSSGSTIRRSPGRTATYVTSRQLRDRLMRELQSNVALRVRPNADEKDEFFVSGRGLLAPVDPDRKHAPRGLRAFGRQAARHLPRSQRRRNWSRSNIWSSMCPTAHVGSVMELVGNRRAECVKLDTRGDSAHIEFTIPARGLIGLRTRHVDRHQRPGDHAPYLLRLSAAIAAPSPAALNGVMISTETGKATAVRPRQACRSAARSLSAPTEPVYEGQVVGEHCRDNDLPVNVCKEKKLTNMRASGSDKSIILKPPRQHDAGARAGIHRGGRAGRGDAERDPPAQDVSQGERPQEAIAAIAIVKSGEPCRVSGRVPLPGGLRRTARQGDFRLSTQVLNRTDRLKKFICRSLNIHNELRNKTDFQARL